MNCTQRPEVQIGTHKELGQKIAAPQPATSPVDELAGLLKDQAKDLNENLKTTLTLYVTWYNFFITLNAAALAFASDKGPRNAVAVVFLVLNTLGGISCLLIRSYATALASKIHLTRQEIWRRLVTAEDRAPPGGPLYFETVTVSVINWSIIGNFLGVMLFEVIWVLLLVGTPRALR